MRLTHAFMLSMTLLGSASALSLEKKSFPAEGPLSDHWRRDFGAMQKRHKPPHSGGGPPSAGGGPPPPPPSAGGPPQSGGGPVPSRGGPPPAGGGPPPSGGGPPPSGGGPPPSGGGQSGDYPCKKDSDCMGKHLKSDAPCFSEQNSNLYCKLETKTCHARLKPEFALSFCQCTDRNDKYVDACVQGTTIYCVDTCSATNTQICSPGHNPCKGEPAS